MKDIPFLNRINTRLTLLILTVVAVLALATVVLVVRGFNFAQQGVVALAQGEVADPEALANLSAIIRSTLINLVAIFLFTLMGAAVFSRTLLTEPIAQLVRGTRELTSGNLGVTLSVTSRSELGLLAENFNAMSVALAEARDLLEQRVQERTSDLRALLELSNSTALSLELLPLLDKILERLKAALGPRSAIVLEAMPDGSLNRLATHGSPLPEDLAPSSYAIESRRPRVLKRDSGRLALPLVVRERVMGVLLLEHGDPTFFGPSRVRLARAFANQVAVALENTSLYEQALEKAAYDERQHLARELHDSVSQALYAILLGTHTAQRQADRAPEKAKEALAYVESLAQAGIAEMRALIFELRPESLQEEGLVGVLRKQLDALESRHQLETSFRMMDEPELPFGSKQVLFRVAQESLHNIVKHARATHVHVELLPAGNDLQLVVRDDGVGFDTATAQAAPGHLGLTSMRERMAAVAGSLAIESQPAGGTTVTARLPLPAEAAS